MEKLPTPEFSEEEGALIEKLRTARSAEEARSIISEWAAKEEAEAEGKDLRARIEYDLKAAKIYRAAGHLGAAWDALEIVLQHAEQVGEQDLYDEAMRLMDEMEAE